MGLTKVNIPNMVDGYLPFSDILGASLNVLDFGAVADGVTDDSAAIQAAIDQANTDGGGTVFFPNGSYAIATSIKPKSYVNLIGEGAGTQLLQKGSSAIETTTLTQVEKMCIKGFRFVYSHATPSQSHMALQLRTHQYCVFQDLWFDNYATSTGAASNDGQTIINIQPNSTVAGKLNFILNRFDNIIVEECRIGIYYEGLDGGSTPGPTQTSGTYIASNVISGNVWSNITLKAVYYRGVEAVQWADSERFFGFWAQCAEENVILLNLNANTTYWWQIDRFDFYAPVLTYLNSAVADASTVTAIRLGPGTLRMFFHNVISDKTWNATKGAPVTGVTFFEDDSSESYWMSLGHTGESANIGPSISYKGMSSNNAGEAIILATNTTVTVTHGLRRTPLPGEIQVTPLSNLEVGGTSRSFWVGATTSTAFVLHISSSHPTIDLNFGWQGCLGPY